MRRPATGPRSAARRAKKEAPDAGGWNIYVTVAGEFDVNSPITNAYLSASCGNSLPGWPCDKPLDELRTAWIRETVPAKRKELLDAVPGTGLRGRPLRLLRPVFAGLCGAQERQGSRPAVGHPDPLGPRQVALPHAGLAPADDRHHGDAPAPHRRHPACDGGGGGARLPADPPLARGPGRADRRRPGDDGGHRQAAHLPRPGPAAVAAVRHLGRRARARRPRHLDLHAGAGDRSCWPSASSRRSRSPC